MSNQVNAGIALSLFAALVGGVGYIAKSTHETGVAIEHRLTKSESNHMFIVQSLDSLRTVAPKVSELKIEMSIMKSAIKDINHKIGLDSPHHYEQRYYVSQEKE